MQFQEYERARYEDRAMEGSGFFATLFDFSFSRFITVRIVTILYAFAILVALFVVVLGVLTAFSRGFLEGIIGLVLAPVALFVYIILARVWLEFLVVIFRIADHSRQIAVNTGGTGES